MAVLVGLSLLDDNGARCHYRACHGSTAHRLDLYPGDIGASFVDHWVRLYGKDDDAALVQLGWKRVGRGWLCPECALTTAKEAV